MADLYLGSGNDVFNQAGSGVANWSGTVYGLDGNDVFILTGLTAVGGRGNDRIEVSSAPNSTADAAYWDTQVGVWVDLQSGTAIDGWGGHDTLIGVTGVHGGSGNDTMFGSAADESFAPNGGHDVIDGRGGTDSVGLGGKLADYLVDVSIDGNHASIRKISEPGLLYELTGIERLTFWENDNFSVDLSDLIKVSDLAVGTLAAATGYRWNASQPMGSPVQVTYSFMQAAPAYGGAAGVGFVGFSASQQQVTEGILAGIAAATGLSFRRVADDAVGYGQIRFAISQQSATTGFSYYPNQAGAGERSGDVWMDVETMADLSVGGLGYAMLVHEVGHALGLRHPGNYLPGETLSPVLAASDDDTGHSVMSYNGQLDEPPRDGFGAYDMLALRAIYGTEAVHTGNDTWVLDDATGRAMRLIVDDGGHDLIDASALSLGVRLDLSASLLGSLALSSAGLAPDGTAAVDNLSVLPGSVIEDAIGTAFDDVLIGNAASNRFTGGTGNDRIDGREGLDTAVFAGTRDAFQVTRAAGELKVSAHDEVSGYDTLVSIERLVFSDFSVNLTVQATAAGVSTAALHRLEELYVAFFNRTPAADGLEYWIGQFDSGATLSQIADSFYSAGIQYSSLTGYRSDMSNADFVNTVYRNVLGRPDGAAPDGLKFWTTQLAAGKETRGSLVSSILDSAHTFKGDPSWGWVADLLDNKIVVADKFAVQWGLNFNTPQEAITRGIEIAAHVTSTGTDAAIALIGVSPEHLDLMGGA